MLIPNRFDSLDDYRYGFQGQEKDDEIKGGGNSLNYTFMMHDPRVGRFFAVYPLSKDYPFYSPFSFSGNILLDAKELEGKEPGFNFGLWLTGQIIKLKLSLTNNTERLLSPIKQNNENINNNILISEERKQQLYHVDAISSSVDLSGKLFLGSIVANVLVIGGGTIAAEAGALSAASSVISTELGYMATSGPVWARYFSSQLSFQGILETSSYNMTVNSSTSLFGQLASNNFKFDENINISQPFFAGLTRGSFSNLGESSFSFNYSNTNGFSFSGNSFSGFMSNYLSNSFGNKMNEKSQNFLKPITDFSSSTKPIFDIYLGASNEFIENAFGKEIEDKLNKQFGTQENDNP